jgi:hypothetical protein
VPGGARSGMLVIVRGMRGETFRVWVCVVWDWWVFGGRRCVSLALANQGGDEGSGTRDHMIDKVCSQHTMFACTVPGNSMHLAKYLVSHACWFVPGYLS